VETVAESGEQKNQQESQQGQAGNGADARKTALRAAAIAAASGATAIAAKRAFSDRSSSGPSNGGSRGGEESLVGGMLGSGWHAAKDSLVPFAEDAAKAAGEYLATSGPDFVRDTIVPSFIAGFQGAQQGGGD
jgi:hypothetical protein